jgi:hypothetical protein
MHTGHDELIARAKLLVTVSADLIERSKMARVASDELGRHTVHLAEAIEVARRGHDDAIAHGPPRPRRLFAHMKGPMGLS